MPEQGLALTEAGNALTQHKAAGQSPSRVLRELFASCDPNVAPNCQFAQQSSASNAALLTLLAALQAQAKISSETAWPTGAPIPDDALLQSARGSLGLDYWPSVSRTLSPEHRAARVLLLNAICTRGILLSELQMQDLFNPLAWIIGCGFPVCQGDGWAGFVPRMLSASAPGFAASMIFSAGLMLQLRALNIPVVFCDILLVALPWDQCEVGFDVDMCQIMDDVADLIAACGFAGFFVHGQLASKRLRPLLGGHL